MRRLHVVAIAVGLALALFGCPQKPKPGAGTGSAKPGDVKKPTDVKKPVANPNALPADTAWASGKIQGASLELETKLEVPGLKGKGKTEVKPVPMTQAIWATEGRGKVVFTTKNSYIPEGTELRYDVAQKKYVLADPGKKEYWSMTGSMLGNLLEGGPELKRSNYTVNVTETKDKEKIAGFDTIKAQAEIGFNAKVKTKTGEKSANIKINLEIWHSADAKLKDAWGDTMISLLLIPFQEPDGQAVMDTLKNKIKFPVKVAMEVTQEGKQEKGEAFPKLVTTATKLEIQELDKAGLAWPPADFKPATAPYQFGEGGQTATEEQLGKLPAKKGTPPKGVEPATDDKKATPKKK